MTVAVANVRRNLRLRRPTIDTRVLTGIVLVGLSVIAGLRLSGSPAPTTRVWIATAPLGAGHVLTRADLAVAEIRGPAATVAGVERAGARAPLGRALRIGLRAGATIPLDALGSAVRPGREITVPVEPEHALGGTVRVGDRVDVYATFDKNTDAARTLTVAHRAVVRGVTRSDGLFGQRDGALSALTVSVDPDAAIGLAFAVRNGELDVVRATGAGRTGPDRFDADALR